MILSLRFSGERTHLIDSTETLWFISVPFRPDATFLSPCWSKKTSQWYEPLLDPYTTAATPWSKLTPHCPSKTPFIYQNTIFQTSRRLIIFLIMRLIMYLHRYELELSTKSINSNTERWWANAFKRLFS